jgi:hypothetical protein
MCCNGCAGAALPEGTEKYIFYSRQGNATFMRTGKVYCSWGGDGQEIVNTLRANGIHCSWDGNPSLCILISDQRLLFEFENDKGDKFTNAQLNELVANNNVAPGTYKVVFKPDGEYLEEFKILGEGSLTDAQKTRIVRRVIRQEMREESYAMESLSAYSAPSECYGDIARANGRRMRFLLEQLGTSFGVIDDLITKYERVESPFTQFQEDCGGYLPPPAHLEGCWLSSAMPEESEAHWHHRRALHEKAQELSHS